MDTLPTDIIHCIFKFISYFELDDVLDCFLLTCCEYTCVKYKIYTSRLTNIIYNNRIEYLIEGKLHREEDLPAVEYMTGGIEFYYNGHLHRIGLPAAIYSYGNKQWWMHGKRHRENGPAVEWSDGYKEWWVHGKRHRIGGPAVEYANGSKFWWVNGVLHRSNGPAAEYADGTKEYWRHGKSLAYYPHTSHKANNNNSRPIKRKNRR